MTVLRVAIVLTALQGAAAMGEKPFPVELGPPLPWTFGEPPQVAHFGIVFGAEVALLNDDPWPDLVIGSSDVWVSLGAPGGGLAAAKRLDLDLAFVSGGYPLGVTDVDQDGELDVVVASIDKDVLVVALGHGDGTFEPGIYQPAAEGTQSLALGDLDEDGRPDVVQGTEDAIHLRRGAGHGLFHDAHQVIPIDEYASHLVADDINGDGHCDVAVCLFLAHRVEVYHGDGTGSLTLAQTLPTPGELPNWLEVSDWNGDGLNDLIVASYNPGRVRSFVQQRGGGWSTQDLLATDSTLRSLLVRDLDADGHLDLAVTLRSHDGLLVAMRDKAGEFRSIVEHAAPNASMTVSAADVTADGVLDLILGGLSSSAVVYPGRGDGSYDGPVSAAHTAALSHVTVTDLDGDAQDEVLSVASAPPILCVHRFVEGQMILEAECHSLPVAPSEIDVADLNGDAWIDVVVRCSTQALIFSASARGTLELEQTIDLGGTASSINLVDEDLNGAIDLVVTRAVEPTGLRVHHNDGDGAFAPPVLRPLSFVPGRAIMRDFDDDGIPDFVGLGVLETGSVLHSVRGLGLGAYEVVGTIDPSMTPSALALADLNGDGHDEVVLWAWLGWLSVIELGNDLVFGAAQEFDVDIDTYTSEPSLFDCDQDDATEIWVPKGDPSSLYADQVTRIFESAGATALPVAQSATRSVLPRLEPLDLIRTGRGDEQLVLLRDSGRLLLAAPSTIVACPGDVDRDGVVGTLDLLLALETYGPCVLCPADLNQDQDVDLRDVLAILTTWGPCP